jgi:hypothetical protein
MVSTSLFLGRGTEHQYYATISAPYNETVIFKLDVRYVLLLEKQCANWFVWSADFHGGTYFRVMNVRRGTGSMVVDVVKYQIRSAMVPT